MRKLYSAILLVCLSLSIHAQKKSFNIDELPNVLIRELNKFRLKNGLDTFEVNEVLAKAAGMSSVKYAKAGGQVTVDPSKTQKNLVKSGATKKGEEVAMVAPVSKGRDTYSTEEVAKVIWTRWESNKRDKPIVLSAQYMLIGMSCTMDEDNKKVYVSAVLGGYNSFNTGAKKKKELAVPFNNKSKKLQGADLKACKNCDKFKNYDVLQKGLYVEDGKIYLKYDNIRDLKKLIKKTKDGLAVDIVQLAQYEKADYNILDNNQKNKGIMTRVVYKDKLFAKNLIQVDPLLKRKSRLTKMKVELGKFNTKIKGPYELNLVVIQDGHICRTVMRSYLEENDQESSTPIGLLAAEGSTGIKPAFEPRSESAILNFNIPFAKNKSEFKAEDIQPFLTAMNEPDFLIEGLYIYAYSSIEGDSISNTKLQHKRAESIVKVLQSRQKLQIKPVIQTRDAWSLFAAQQVNNGPYADLVGQGKKKALQRINTNGPLLQELEPVLAKQRFAQIVMDVTYDISGDKEQRFSTISFNKAVAANNTRQANRIMEYIYKKAAEGAYTDQVWNDLKIPDSAAYAGLLMNKVYYDYLLNNREVSDENYTEVKRIAKMDPKSDVLKYNLLYCNIKVEPTLGKSEDQTKVQQGIDALYKSSIPKKLVDGLNIEWQFKIIEAMDTVEGELADIQIEACITKIKSFYNFKEASWQNSLKLANVFTRAKDYKFACSLLEPYLDEEKVDENLLFSYISIASHLPEKFYARNFSKAMSLAKENYPDRFCKLFGDPYISFQVLDNPTIKKDYNEAHCTPTN